MNVHTPKGRPYPCSEEEWQVRCDLAALYRLVAHFRMTDFIFTHISARVPGPEHHFLINSYGVHFHEMRASDLVKIDGDGNVMEDGSAANEVNAAGFTIHSAVHRAREDLACVVHTHTAAGIAVSAQKQGLLPISQHALKYHGRLAYHGYEGVALDLDERERLVADLGPHDAMILRNHGLLAAGRSVPEAFDNIYFLERACQAQVAALAGGAELVFRRKRCGRAPPSNSAATVRRARRGPGRRRCGWWSTTASTTDPDPAHHPAMPLKIRVHGYLNRIRSSRRLEREAGRDISQRKPPGS